jgi:DNA-binding Lrp family transcriptional regulator
MTTKSVKARVDKMVSRKVIKRFDVIVNPSIVGYKGMYTLVLKENQVSKDLIEKINLVGQIHIRNRVLGGDIGYGIAVKSVGCLSTNRLGRFLIFIISSP